MYGTIMLKCILNENEKISTDDLVDLDVKEFREFLQNEKLELPEKYKKSSKIDKNLVKSSKRKCKVKWYKITLTTPHQSIISLEEDLDKIISSKMFKLTKLYIARELTQSGLPHYHLLAESKNSIYASYLKKIIEHRFECKPLPTEKDRDDWLEYINKKKEKKEIDYFDKLKKETKEKLEFD